MSMAGMTMDNSTSMPNMDMDMDMDGMGDMNMMMMMPMYFSFAYLNTTVLFKEWVISDERGKRKIDSIH